MDDSASFAQNNSRDAKIAAFQDVNGSFVSGDTGIYALDYSGVALALPFRPGMVGTNFLPLRDATGKPYTQAEIATARAGIRYVPYHYQKPSGDPYTNRTALKVNYDTDVDGSWFPGAGRYIGPGPLILRP